MRQFVVRYTAKAARLAENRALIEAVFAELETVKPAGVSYMVLELVDGGFIHIVTAPDDPAANPIPRLAAFRRFAENAADRHETPAANTDMTIIGDYRG
jgi:hypothetical protein